MALRFILVSLVTVTACGSGSDGGHISPISKEELAEFQSCQSDSDCTIAQNGCCDCANGGEDVAVSKDSLDEFLALFSCADILCTELGREPVCGSGSAKCTDGLCEYL